MAVRIGSGLSVDPEAHVGAEEAAAVARAGLGGAPCDLAVVFASGAHLQAPEATLEAVQDTLGPGALVGCGAQGVLADGREVEHGTGVAVWAAALGEEGRAEAFHSIVEPVPGGGAMVGLPDFDGAAGAILLPDPFTFPADQVLYQLSERHPGLPLIGGIASARLPGDTAALFLDGEVIESGAVGVRFEGIELLPCVSQGAAPVGPELTITGAEGNVILELAGRPAYERLQEAVEGLDGDEKELLERSGGLLLGIVIEPNKPDYVQGDFLVRPLHGADPVSGAVAVAALVRPGQVVRLHARDPESADRDLRDALGRHRLAFGGRPPAGALVFACNGRGQALFGEPDHDAGAVAEMLAAPAAGFFAAGEIGPVGGECFLHGFTATVAVFAP